MRIHTTLDLSQDELRTVVQENHKATYKLLLSTFTTGFIWPAVALAVTWDKVESLPAIIWISVVAAFILIRLYVLTQWYKPKQSQDGIHFWENIALVLTFCLASMWGVAMYSLDLQELGYDFYFLSIIIFAIISASIGLACYWVYYFWSFTVPMAAYYTSFLFISLPNNEYLFLTAAVIFIFYLRQIVYTYHSNIIENILLRERVEHMAENLETQKVQAEQLAESRKNFLASASHDLRQPLQALNFFQTALKPFIKEKESQKIFSKMESSTEGMNELLSQILDISKLDSNTLSLNIKTFDIQSLTEKLEQEFRPNAQERSLDLSIQSTPAKLTTDAVLLQRILSNLLANAINYTEHGGVCLDCHIIEDKLVIDIIDTGPGISEEQQQYIFDEFYQVGNIERDRKKGLGLGLSIVKRLCNILDIELSFESRLDEGSRFSISLPLELERSIDTDLSVDTSDWQISDSTVLIIDDEESVLDGLATLFQQWEFKVLLASSAKEAIHLLQQRGESAVDYEKPGLIVSDYRLRDGFTGVEAIEDVKVFLREPELPALIISGDTAPERLTEVAESGYILLHKPVKPAFLRSAVQRLLVRSDT